MIAIIDYGTGNLRSVENAFGRIGAEVVVTSNPATILAADKVLLPGVGNAAVAMGKLREYKLDQLLLSINQPVLGICVGMQIMCNGSEEGDVRCLGIFDANVTKLSATTVAGEAVKIPHMGWNRVEKCSSPLFDGVDDGTFFYYVHSFAPEISQHTIAQTVHGLEFSVALANRNFFGTQFHPEKSGDAGEKLLENFLKL